MLCEMLSEQKGWLAFAETTCQMCFKGELFCVWYVILQNISLFSSCANTAGEIVRRVCPLVLTGKSLQPGGFRLSFVVTANRKGQ